VLLAGPRGAVARLLLTGRAGEFSVFPSVGVAAFSAGLAVIGTRLAADGAGGIPDRCDRGDGHGGGHRHRAPLVRDEEAIASVPAACPMARSETVSSGHSRTT
jgi:hypothetical protein